MTAAVLRDHELELVGAVERRLGLSLRPGIQAILIEVGRELIAAGHAGSFGELLARIRGAEDSHPVVQELRYAASIGETHFFRHPRQLEDLARVARTHLLPVKRARKERTLRVWSVGCSTGEEAYTLAMMLLPLAGDLELSVSGTDMNERSIATAREGIYGPRSVRGELPVWAQEHLQRSGNRWEVSAALRQRVRFGVLNLVNDPVPNLPLGAGRCDLIVCRNVLIYLDAAHLPRVMGKLQAAAASTALFAVSPAEYSATVHLSGVKRMGNAVLLREAPAPEVKPSRSAPAEGPRLPLPSPAGAAASPTFEALFSLAGASADQARYGEALALVEQAQRLRPDSAALSLLRARIALAAGDLDRAGVELRQSQFLDRNCIATQLGLGQLYRRRGQPAEAQRHFARTVRLLAPLAPDMLVEHLGITVQAARALAADEPSGGAT